MQAVTAGFAGWVLAASMSLSPALAAALGLGPMVVDSALNEPLRARIELVSAKSSELNTLRVTLADGELFERAGIERGRSALDLRFEVVQASGYVMVSSKAALREPALRFVVEAIWSRGRAVRSYSVLLGLR